MVTLLVEEKLAGNHWSGNLYFTLDNTNKHKASGRVSGYAWYFQSTTHSWSIEIAEDPTIEESELPLVGYGCGGWLYESNKDILPDDLIDKLPNNEANFILFINKELELVFTLFAQNKLNYLPVVTCGCTD